MYRKRLVTKQRAQPNIYEHMPYTEVTFLGRSAEGPSPGHPSRTRVGMRVTCTHTRARTHKYTQANTGADARRQFIRRVVVVVSGGLGRNSKGTVSEHHRQQQKEQQRARQSPPPL